MTKSMAEYRPITVAAPTRQTYANHVGILSAQLNAVLPRTADTGQTSPSTLLSNQSLVGMGSGTYEAFAFNDALQATKPIYIRMSYSFATTTTIAVTVGTGTDGAGNLTGIIVGSLQLSSATNTNLTGAPRLALASSDGSYLAFFYNIQNPAIASYPQGTDALAGFVVERTRDADGTPNGNGFMVYHWGANALELNTAFTSVNFVATYSRIYSAGAAQPATPAYDLNAFIPGQGNNLGLSNTLNNTVNAYPIFGYAGPVPQGPSKALMVGYTAELPRTAVVSFASGGTTTQWIPLWNTIPSAFNSGGTLSSQIASKTSVLSISPLVRWE